MFIPRLLSESCIIIWSKFGKNKIMSQYVGAPHSFISIKSDLFESGSNHSSSPTSNPPLNESWTVWESDQLKSDPLSSLCQKCHPWWWNFRNHWLADWREPRYVSVTQSLCTCAGAVVSHQSCTSAGGRKFVPDFSSCPVVRALFRDSLWAFMFTSAYIFDDESQDHEGSWNTLCYAYPHDYVCFLFLPCRQSNLRNWSLCLQREITSPSHFWSLRRRFWISGLRSSIGEWVQRVAAARTSLQKSSEVDKLPEAEGRVIVVHTDTLKEVVWSRIRLRLRSASRSRSMWSMYITHALWRKGSHREALVRLQSTKRPQFHHTSYSSDDGWRKFFIVWSSRFSHVLTISLRSSVPVWSVSCLDHDPAEVSPVAADVSRPRWSSCSSRLPVGSRHEDFQSQSSCSRLRKSTGVSSHSLLSRSVSHCLYLNTKSWQFIKLRRRLPVMYPSVRLGTLSSKCGKKTHPKTLSSKNTFVQNHLIQNRRQFHPRHFYPKTVSSNDTFIPNHFHPTLNPKP